MVPEIGQMSMGVDSALEYAKRYVMVLVSDHGIFFIT